MTRALPTEPWGPGRLDAVAMIFNRLTGLDLGKPPSYLIPDNIQRADGAGPLPVPVERSDPGQDAVAGLRRQRQRHPGARPQSRRGLRRVRDLPSAERRAADPGRQLPRQQLGQLRRAEPAGEAGPQARAAEMAVGGRRGAGGPGQGDLRAADGAGWLHRVPRDQQGRGEVPGRADLEDATAGRRHRHQGIRHPRLDRPDRACSRVRASRSSTARLGKTDAAFKVLSTSVLGSILQRYAPLTAAAHEAEAGCAQAAAAARRTCARRSGDRT